MCVCYRGIIISHPAFQHILAEFLLTIVLPTGCVGWQALYDLDRADPTELAFKRGDLIDVVSDVNSNVM